MEIVLLLLAFFGMATFIMVGVDLFSRGWEGYEERYVKGAEKTLDSMFLTIPPQNLLYLSLLFYILLAIAITVFSGQLVLGAVIGVVGFFIPQIALKVMKKRRDEKFGKQLVDALTTMANALGSGLSLPQAIETVARDMENPIRQEFRMLNQELQLGTKMDVALGNFQRRIPNPDLMLMNTAITISQEVGGNLSEVFKNISGTVRERHRLESNIKAHTSQGKMQGYVLCMVPFAMGGLLSFLFPSMMEPLYTTSIGWLVIFSSLILMALGGFFISRIVNIDI